MASQDDFMMEPSRPVVGDLADSTVSASLKDPDWDNITPASASFYWKMRPPLKGSVNGGQIGKMAGYGPAPRLSPANESTDPTTGDHMDEQASPSTHVNVRDKHHWTESPISSRREVPMLMLKELRILTNPMLNQVMNNVAVGLQTGAGIVDGAATAVENTKTAITEIRKLATDENGAFDSKALANNMQNAQEVGNEMLEKAGAAAKEMMTGTESGYANPLNPYSLMYTVTPTKFKYTFPYMENTYVQKSGTFGGGEQTAAGGLLTAGSSIIAEGLADLSLKKLAAPGRLIEEPKGFTFTGREKSYTVKFPLFNTKNFEEIIRNWQFIFLLTYQNTPNRITRDLIDPPCIYEAKIPGMWYSKYSSITNMTVDFMGARREMAMPVPYLETANDSTTGEDGSTSESNWLLQKRKITTIIPDAYMVSITVTELFSETQNFMYHMVKESMSDKISVTKSKQSPF